MRRASRIATAAAAALATAFAAPATLAANAGPSQGMPSGKAPGAAPAGDEPCPGAQAVPTSRTRAATARTVLCLVNEERRSRGLGRLRDEPHLRRAAQGQARALAAAGRAPRSSADNAEERITASGYAPARGFVFAEALGHGTARASTPAQRVAGWLRSAASRSIVLSPAFRDAGVAAVTQRGHTTYVLELAGPARKHR